MSNNDADVHRGCVNVLKKERSNHLAMSSRLGLCHIWEDGDHARTDRSGPDGHIYENFRGFEYKDCMATSASSKAGQLPD